MLEKMKRNESVFENKSVVSHFLLMATIYRKLFNYSCVCVVLSPSNNVLVITASVYKYTKADGETKNKTTRKLFIIK